MANPHRKAQPPEDEDDDIEEYPVAPLDPTARQREPMLFGPPYDGYFHEEPQEPQPFQFSLADLLTLVTAVAVFCGIGKMLAGRGDAVAFAGVLGLAVLIGMIVVRAIGVTRPIVRLGWWIGLGLYFTACVVSIIRG